MDYVGKRISILRKEDELSIVISATENRSPVITWLIWNVLWTFCGVYIMMQYFSETEESRKLFYIVFAGFWIYFEFRGLKALFWKLKGREVIKVRGEELLIGKRIFSKGKAMRFTLEEVRDLKMTDKKDTSPVAILKSIDIFSPRDVLSLSYFGKEYKFGDGLNEEDADALADLLIKEVKRRKSSR